MKTITLDSSTSAHRCTPTNPVWFHYNNRGQALVEFTLVFLLLLIVAWIPADFGLAFFTGQIAQHASREGARIASASPVLPAADSCVAPCNGRSDILVQTARRVSMALLPTPTISFDTINAACDAGGNKVRVRVQGNYNFFFYRLLNLFGAGVGPSTTIDRVTVMRWEHQC